LKNQTEGEKKSRRGIRQTGEKRKPEDRENRCEVKGKSVIEKRKEKLKMKKTDGERKISEVESDRGERKKEESTDGEEESGI